MIRGGNPPLPGRIPRQRRAAGALAAVTLGLAGLAGCGAQHTERECGLDYCLVTFDRGVDARTSVLGVDARLIGASTDTVTVQLGGEQLVLSTEEQAARVGGLYVSVEAVNDQQAVLRVGRTRSS
ncbi:hypothetical protein ACFFWC_14680 [Plantactinospora siamensis]|uniref:Uncharacterized protein n=1 Tax=Plantactinospora siamensis TaxID=555372 RepID=A0ABV6P102_9ACTN